MKIGLVTGEYAPMQGGVGDFTREIARALAALNHKVHVITNLKSQTLAPALRSGPFGSAGVSNLKPDERGQNELVAAGCHSERSEESLSPDVGTLRFAQGDKSEQPDLAAAKFDDDVRVERVIDGWGWGCWRALSNEAKRFGLDVVNIQFQTAAYNMHPAIHLLPLARRVNPLIRWPHPLPVVVTFHDLRAPYLFPKAGPLRRQVVLALARYSDAVIITNPEDEVDLKSAIHNPKSKIARIPIGSNIAPRLSEGYDRDEWRARYGVRPDQALIGYFGFLHPLKGGEVLIRALAELANEGRDVKLLHIGGRTGSSDADTNAAYAARVESLARELGAADRIIATGFVTPEQVTANFYAADIFALPYVEGASFRHGTFHAALAHGRAIVTTTPPIPLEELRSGENVLLVPPDDPHALAEGIRSVMDDAALRARLERGAAALSQMFTWDRIAAQTVRVFEQVVG